MCVGLHETDQGEVAVVRMPQHGVDGLHLVCVYVVVVVVVVDTVVLDDRGGGRGSLQKNGHL